MTRRLLLLLALAPAAVAGELRDAENEVIRLLKKVQPAVVTVITPNKRDADMSGVIVASNGVILTLRSPLLARGSSSLRSEYEVRVAGAKRTEIAKVIDQDVSTDTVLLLASGAKGRSLRTGSVAQADIGEWVLLVGNAFGTGRESTPSSSLGVVSGRVRTADDIKEVHVSALVNPGTVGAPVLDSSGYVLGIAAPRITAAGGQTIVVPIDRIRTVYRAKKTAGRRVFPSSAARATSAKRMTGAFGMVVAAAAAEAGKVLVGVRAEPLETDDLRPPPPPKTREEAARLQRSVQRVKGKRRAWDRCSGTIVGKDGLIICPLRITGWPNTTRKLAVDLLDGTTLPAKVLGTDERLRIALLQVQRKDLPVLPPAARDTVRSGRFAVAVGYPHEYPDAGTPQVTVGIISRTQALGSLHPLFSAVQTDAGIAGGNRGGPLVDIDGKLLGVIVDVNDSNPQGYFTRRRGSFTGNAGNGFAVPPMVLDLVIARMRRGETLRAAFFGVSVQAAEKGLQVMAVTPQNSQGDKTAAAQAALQVGDVITALDGKVMKSPPDFTAELAFRTVGETFEITWFRAGKPMRAKVTLTER